MSFVLVALSAVSMALAYPSADAWTLVFVAWAPLLVALRGASARRRLLLGWLTGALITAISHAFIAGTIVNMGGLSWALAVPLFVLYAAWHGGQVALFAWSYGYLRQHGGRWLWLLTTPLAFALFERWYPIWFQAYISNVLWHAPLLTQGLDVIGPSGLTAAVLLVSCALAELVAVWRADRRAALPPVGVAVAVWGALLAYGLVREAGLAQIPVDGTVRVTMLQPNVAVSEKRDPDGPTRERVWKRTVAMTREALADQPELLVWPEGALPVTYDPDAYKEPGGRGPTTLRLELSRKIHALARQVGVPFAAGSLRVAGDSVANSALLFTPGEPAPVLYDKRKLVLLAERVPLADTFPSLATALPGLSHHVPGDRFEQLRVKGVPFAPSMCYEAVFPGITRESLAAAGEGAVLLNLTNDVWFGDTSEASVHLMMQVPRAVENRVWVVRATNSGISAVIDPAGRVVAETPQFQATRLTFEVPIQRFPPTFYHRFGDLVVEVLGGLGALGMAWRLRRARP